MDGIRPKIDAELVTVAKGKKIAGLARIIFVAKEISPPEQRFRGTLSISNIANAGSNSNIGAYAYAGAAGLVLNGGAFNYTGSTTTNRGFTMTGEISTLSVAAAGAKLTMGDSIFNSTTNQTLTVNGGAGSSLDLSKLTYSNKSITAGIAVNIDKEK